MTHDGGRHWTPTAPVPTISLEGYPDIPYSFPDARHGFILMGKRLYRTSDGGRHWQAITAPIPLDARDTIQFFDGRQGLALQPGDTSGRRSILWRTADGGETWKVVPAMDESFRVSIEPVA
ncbi:MAG: YCF48-related protein [Chloroflexota bacterium]|nr:YCF48-related protein [Chloroflexota bacterium]